MADSTRAATLLLQYVVDPAAASKSIADSQKIGDAVTSVQTEVNSESAKTLQLLLQTDEAMKHFGQTENAVFDGMARGLGVTREMVEALIADLTRLQGLQSGGGGTAAGLLGHADEGAAIGFERELLALQEQEAAAREHNLDMSRMISAEIENQTTEAQVLINATNQRLIAEQNIAETIREEVFETNKEVAANMAASGGAGGGAGGAGGGDDGGGGFSLTGSRRAITALGSLLGPQLGGGAVSEIARVVTLGAAFGGIGAAIGVAAIALRNNQQAYDDSKKSITDETTALRKEVQARQELAAIIERGSIAGVRSQIADLTQQRTDEQTVQDRLRAQFRDVQAQAANEGINPGGGASTRIAAQAVDPSLVGRYDQLIVEMNNSGDTIFDLTKKIHDFETQGLHGAASIERITQLQDEYSKRYALSTSSDLKGLDEQIGQFSNDLAANGDQQAAIDIKIKTAQANRNDVEVEALKAYQATLAGTHDQIVANLYLYTSMREVVKANQDLARSQEIAAKQAQLTVQATDEAEQLTKAQRDDRIKEINREIANLQEAKKTLGLSSEAIADFNSQINGLVLERGVLARTAQSIADIAAASQALTDKQQSYLDVLKDLGAAQDALTEAQKAYNDAETEHKDNLTTITDEQAAKDLAAQQKRDKAIGEAEEKARTNLAEALAQIEKQSAQRQLDIRTNADRNIRELIAKGQQAAAQHALEDRDAALKQEHDQTVTAEEAKTKEIGDQLAEQKKEYESAYKEELAADKKAADQAIDTENKRWAKEKETRQHAIDEALRDTQNLNASLEALRRSNNFQEVYWANAALSTVITKGQGIVQAFVSMLDAMRNQIVNNPDVKSVTPGPANHADSYYGLAIDAGLSQQSALKLQAYHQAHQLDALHPTSLYGWAIDAGLSQAEALQLEKKYQGLPIFSEAGVVTKSGMAWVDKGETFNGLPFAGRAPLPEGGSHLDGGGGSKNVYIVLPKDWKGDEQKVARLVRQEIQAAKPVLRKQISDDLAKIERQGGH